MDIYYSNAYVHNWDIKAKINPFPTLISFYNFPKSFKRQKSFSKLMLDSGAFSAWRQKKSINVYDYIEFIKNNKTKFDEIISLDIFGQDDLSFNNFKIMTKAGLKVMPVYHADANIKYLYKYIDYTNYIGLGGFAKSYKRNRYFAMKKVFKEFNDSTKIGFHGFGVNDIELMKIFPWKSVDASTAHILARLGNILTPFGIIALSNSISQDRQKWKSIKKLNIIEEYFNKINADYLLACQGNVNGTIERCRININYMEKYVKPQVPLLYNEKTNCFNLFNF